ncbi:MAG: C1 family peptidase [Burkholderiales bacterium]
MKRTRLPPGPGQFAAIFRNSGLDHAETIPIAAPWAVEEGAGKLENALVAPPRATWHGHTSLPPVSSQLPYNTCVSHAACRMVETWARQHATTVSLDAECLHQCIYGFDCMQPSDNASDVLLAMLAKGVPRRQGFVPRQACPAPLDAYVTPRIKRIGSSDEAKEHIATHGPVIAILTLGQDFEHLRTPAVYADPPSASPTFNHAVLIVGYDDNFEGGSWHCQNSFGAGWGAAGYFWLRYGSGGFLQDDDHAGFCARY